MTNETVQDARDDAALIKAAPDMYLVCYDLVNWAAHNKETRDTKDLAPLIHRASKLIDDIRGG